MSWGERMFTAGRELFRTKRWQQLRTKVPREQPLCVMGGKRERCCVGATEVDHIKPHRGERLLFDCCNLQGLCRSRHAEKTAREVLYKGPGSDETGMPLDKQHPWSKE
jgi:5-methylcytosine-specific restriction endonuclease McrA